LKGKLSSENIASTVPLGIANEHSKATIHKHTDTAHYLTKEEKQKI